LCGRRELLETYPSYHFEGTGVLKRTDWYSAT
jgi:hypothetical protein